jgi:Cu2+-exporting ATPase
MVGDGINDALALRNAAVGVAVRGGAEAALQVADVYLATNDLRTLDQLVAGAQRTLSTIRRNLGFSLGYNVLFASLALAGQITPLMAAILMPLSSLTVIASSYLAPTFRREDASRSGAPDLRTAPSASSARP